MFRSLGASKALDNRGCLCPHAFKSNVSNRQLTSRLHCSNGKFNASSLGLVQEAETDDAKQLLARALEGFDRGIFGMKSDRKRQIDDLIKQIELSNEVPEPLSRPDLIAGKWKLLFTSVTITGAKKTKLGLREFVKLRDSFQIIDIENKKAINEVHFAVAGLGTFEGAFTVTASFSQISGQRVQVSFEKSELTPKMLQALFEKNYDLLLSIFNPEGWLDITYVDSTMRIGRDDKGNVFVLERC